MKLDRASADIIRSDGFGQDATVSSGSVLIVDDHELLAQSLAWALRAESFDVAVVPPASREVILEAAAVHRPEVVLLDLELGERVGSALPLIAPLRQRGTLVVMLTGVTSRVRLAECLEAGAAGLLPKSAAFESLVDGVREVVELGTLVTPHRRADLLAELRAQRIERTRRLEPFQRLTKREQDVLRALIEGRSAETIATLSYVSLATVRSQIRSVLQKLSVNSQLAAVALARREGWPPPDHPSAAA
jgi:DNA-binding NarL/FixJ family response regulator